MNENNHGLDLPEAASETIARHLNTTVNDLLDQALLYRKAYDTAKTRTSKEYYAKKIRKITSKIGGYIDFIKTMDSK